jgi:hypothetical protein
MSFAYAYPCAVIGVWLPVLLLSLLLLAHVVVEARDVRRYRFTRGQR